MKSHVKYCILGVLSVLAVNLIDTVPTYAAEASAEVKTEMSAVLECYKNGQMSSVLNSDEWKGIDSITKKTKSVAVVNDSGKVSWTNCQSLMQKVAGQKAPASNALANTLTPFMQSMGYNATTVGDSDGKCATYNFQTTQSGQTQTMRICSTTASDSGMGAGAVTVTRTDLNGGLPVAIVPSGTNNKSVTIRLNSASNDFLGEVRYNSSTDFQDFANKVWKVISDYNENHPLNTQGGNANDTWNLTSGAPSVGSAQGVVRYELPTNTENAGLVAINYLSGGSITSAANTQLTTPQQKLILENALEQFHTRLFGGSESTACNITGDAQSNAVGQGYTPMKISPSKICYVKAGTDGGTVLAFNTHNGRVDGTELNFAQLVQAVTDNVTASEALGLNSTISFTPTPIGTDPGSNPGTGGDPGTSGGGSSTGGDSELPECTKVSGVLSWIVCPVLKFVGEAVGNIYEWVEQTFLMVPSSYMNRGNGVYQGWSDFRNFANILFAIAFAVVIFSQITGIGLSNYNIKKMLPRLIAVAILVNISFILCQLAVDLSNIVGFQVNKLLGTDLVNSLNSGSETSPGIFDMAGIKELTQNLVTGAGAVTGVVLGVSIATITWSLWLLPLFLACVSALIGIVFFFIILGVRQAGIIILVAIAPIAIVCYALPNTKSLFEKWWKMFSALLMVYPICGALMGGGVYAANLMISTNPDSFLFVLIAMLLTILPFFMVPTILNNSMKSMGALGAKISGFSAGLQKRSTDAIRRTGAYQAADEMIRAHRAERANYRRMHRLPERLAGQASRMQSSNNILTRGAGHVVGAASAVTGAVGAAGGAVGRVVRSTAPGAAIGGAIDSINNQRFLRNKQIMRGQRMRQDYADREAQEDYVPGSRLYDADTARMELARQTELIDNEEQIIRNSANFNADNPDNAMVEDMRQTFAATMSADQDEADAAQIRARAYIRAFSESNKGRSAVYDALMGAAHENNTTLASMERQTTGLSNLADYSMKQFGKAYKDNNFPAFELMKDLQGKQYGQVGTIQEVDDITRSLLPGRSYMSSHYDSAGLRGKYKPQNFAGADDAALNGAISALTPGSNNYITDAGARTEIANLSARSISSDLYRPKADDERQHQRIMISGYSAETMGEAGAKALHSIAQGMRDSNLEDTYKTQAVQKARAALEGHHYSSPEVATELNSILTAAGQQPVDLGRVDIGNMQEGDTSAPVQVRDTAPQPQIIQEVASTPQPASASRRRATSRPIITETPLQNGNVRTEVTTTGGTRFSGERRGSSPIILSDEALRNEDLNTWRNNRQNPPQNPPSNP